MKLYTIGIGVTDDKLVLMHKSKPAWQAGKYNFPGGKIEEEESGAECIAREWEEETGVKTTPESWQYVGNMIRHNDFVVYIYYQHNPEFKNCRTVENDEIVLFSRYEFDFGVYDEICLPNVPWLYKFTQTADFKNYKVTITITFPPKDEEEDIYDLENTG